MQAAAGPQTTQAGAEASECSINVIIKCEGCKPVSRYSSLPSLLACNWAIPGTTGAALRNRKYNWQQRAESKEGRLPSFFFVFFHSVQNVFLLYNPYSMLLEFCTRKMSKAEVIISNDIKWQDSTHHLIGGCKTFRKSDLIAVCAIKPIWRKFSWRWKRLRQSAKQRTYYDGKENDR